MNLDMSKLEPLLGKVVNDLGAASNGALVILGDKLGSLPHPVDRRDDVGRARRRDRHARALCARMAFGAGGVRLRRPTRRIRASSRCRRSRRPCSRTRTVPVFVAGGFSILSAVYHDEPKLPQAFKTGKGLHWGEHCNCLFCGVERFFRPGYRAHLVAEWLPALDGVVAKLQRGAKVADVGCGHGASTLLMAEAFPNSEFVGIDFHDALDRACDEAGERSQERPLRGRARRRTLPAAASISSTMFDALHDMGDPVGAVAHIRKTLKADGTLMLVEPMAGDSLADNLNPVGRVYYAGSTHICVPTALNQEVGLALGAQAGAKRIGEVVRDGGFAQFRKAAETPFNMILEARP